MKTWKAKWFGELTIGELYEILRSRSEIFVVEQQCVYQDMDGMDQKAFHVFCEEEGRVTPSGRMRKRCRWAVCSP